jgi:ATP-binding protein involved in chromosome partitioning
LPFLGDVPLATSVRTASDAGEPIVISDPESPAARALASIAAQMAAQVSIRALQAPGPAEPAVTF